MNTSTNEYVKISFTGDIMCEMPLLKSAKSNDGYCFESVFNEVKSFFAESDYVVGNLETICTGSKNGLTDHIYSFNSPVEFLESVKNSGVRLVTTATNHALDRGVKGLLDNLDEINKLGIDSIGTYANEKESKQVFIKTISGINIAFLNYTFGTNCHINGNKLTEEQAFHINLIKSQDEEYKNYLFKKKSNDLKSILARLIFHFISLGRWVKLKKKLGLAYNKPYQDDDLSQLSDEYLEKIKSDLIAAKNAADVVIVCAHMGGQFNGNPGKFSHFMMRFFEQNGADAVVGNHPHVVQKTVRFEGGGLGAYCLGNFSISPSSVYVIHDDLPEYSILLHSYIDIKTKKIVKNTFSILKIEEDNDGSQTVWPLHELYKIVSQQRKHDLKVDALRIYNRFLSAANKELSIKSEYLVVFEEGRLDE